MKNIPENIDWSLMTKVLSSNATSKEKDQFDTWMKADTSNESFFIKTREVWIQSKEERVDTDAALAVVKGKIQTQKTTKSSATTKQYWITPIKSKYVKIAASLIFLMVSLYMVYDQTNKASTLQILSVSTGLDERLQITLPDSSKVFLNAGSTISYPNKFTEEKRPVTLDGEAFFEVRPDPNKPFTITTPNTETTVLGTSFTVTAYPNENIEEVIVETGRVSFRNEHTQENILLMPGDKGTYIKTNRLITKLKNANNNHLSWKTHLVEFNKESLASVFNTLEKTYLISFDTTSATINNCKLTARFNEQTLPSILEAIEMTFDIKIIKENSTYIVYGQGCE
jgi:ferric-dicitrate binding protein FerR (iron transport regulator)